MSDDDGFSQLELDGFSDLNWIGLRTGIGNASEERVHWHSPRDQSSLQADLSVFSRFVGLFKALNASRVPTVIHCKLIFPRGIIVLASWFVCLSWALDAA